MYSSNDIIKVGKSLGFYNYGGFLIGVRNGEILGGFVIDPTPSTIYIWKFFLPWFDEIQFMHMGLGKKVTSIDVLDVPLKDFFNDYWGNMINIKDSCDLLSYIKREGLVGDYALWSKFLCLVRIGNFDLADGLFDSLNVKELSGLVHKKFVAVKNAKQNGGWVGVQNLLSRWSEINNGILKKIPTNISVQIEQ